MRGRSSCPLYIQVPYKKFTAGEVTTIHYVVPSRSVMSVCLHNQPAAGLKCFLVSGKGGCLLGCGLVKSIRWRGEVHRTSIPCLN